jgi:hypothetical protein
MLRRFMLVLEGEQECKALVERRISARGVRAYAMGSPARFRMAGS